MNCDCATEFVLEQARSTDIKPAYWLLSGTRHPAYISNDRLASYARRGGLFYARHDGEALGLAAVRPNVSVLIALNVHPEHRSHGLGSRLLRWVAPNWARVIEGAVPWFEREGFQIVGQPKQGRRHRTFIMVRKDLIGLAGRLDRLHLDEPVNAGEADCK